MASKTRDAVPRAMVAKYDGRCIACSGKIGQGNPIVFVPTVGAFHHQCVPLRYGTISLPSHPTTRDKLHETRQINQPPRRTDKYHTPEQRLNHARQAERSPQNRAG